MPSDVLEPANCCHFCGAPNSDLRIFKHPELGCIYWLSGHICQECVDAGKEQERLKKMLETKCEECKEYNTLICRLHKLGTRKNFNPDSRTVQKIGKRLKELEKSREVRIQLRQQFQEIGLIEKSNFIGEFKTDLNLEKCEYCQDNSHICIFDDLFEVDTKMLHDIQDLFLNYRMHGRLINRAY